MCGISGIYSFTDNVRVNDIHLLNKGLTHRGPDFQGNYLSENQTFGMGHCRLSIVDLKQEANQPFATLDERYWISFNGEIYNYLELRKELESKGEVFRTTSDTEVLLLAFKIWSVKCLDKLNGMFAFAIWDEVEQALFIARDRFGVKPVYFVSDKKQFVFASEQKAFKSISAKYAQLSSAHASASIANVSVIESQRHTIYQHVQKLLPGEYLILRKNNELSIHRWWDTFSEISNLNEPQSIDAHTLLDIFKSACNIRTRTDVKLASTLSGGLDSSAVTSYIANDIDLQKQFRSYIGSFENTAMDEFKWAYEVVKEHSIPYEKITLAPEDIWNHIVNSSISMEDITSLPAPGQWAIYERMKQDGYKVSLEGHSGDELLGGYPSHVVAHAGDLLSTYNNHNGQNKSYDPAELAATIMFYYHLNKNYDSSPSKLKSFLLSSTKSPSAFSKRASLLMPFLPAPDELSTGLISELNNEDFNKKSFLFKKLYLDFHYFRLPIILRNYDRLSMANSVEVRSPFLDYRFVLNAFKAGSQLKINKGWNKVLLRDTFTLIPKKVRQRKDKLGFTPPLAHWLSQVIFEPFYETINEKGFQESGYFDGRAVKNVLVKHLESHNYSQIVNFWPIVNLYILSK